MKKITKTIIALSVLVGLASCAKEQAPVTPETENNGMIALTLTAGQANSETRAAIDGSDSKVINWSAEDAISVFDGDNNNREFTLKDEDAGKTTGTFTGAVTKTSTSGYTALYPYQSGASYDGSKISGVVLSAAQTATAGSFDPKAALMYAQSTTEDGNLEFKNIVGYVKFTTDFECKQITLVSKTSTDVLAGTAEITPGAVQLVSATSGTSSQVSLTAASGNIAAGTYYIALLPGTINGFRLIFTMTDDSRKYKESSNGLVIKSNGVKKLGTISDNADLSAYTNLSSSGTANCYLIQGKGDYMFKAVQGNSATSVGTVASVAVLWESFGNATSIKEGDIIAKGLSSYNDGYILFSTPATFAEGNAVIAAKDASGVILWSWHIWCATEKWKEQTYWDKDDHNKSAGTMMDRNLGATTANVGELGSFGLFYQWGRKDPFLGCRSFTSAFNNYVLSTGTWKNDGTTISAKLATQNPTTFYINYSNVMPNGSWASKKTTQDPCPAGWRVPDGYTTSGVWAKASSTTSGTFANYGINFGGVFGSDETIWYPAAGYLQYDQRYLYDIGKKGNYWSATPHSYDKQRAYFFKFDSAGIYYDAYDYRSAGKSVRCCQE